MNLPARNPSTAGAIDTSDDVLPVADIAMLFDMYQKGLLFHCVCAVTRLGVPDALAAGPRSIAELAADVGADPDALHRVLRLLAGHGYIAFRSIDSDADGDRDGVEVALTGPGLLLSRRHPASLAATFATFGISDVAHALEAVIRTGKPAVADVYGEGFWDHLTRHPEKQAVFGAAMREQARLLSLPCVDLLDWSGADTIVDVAGGVGVLLAAVLKAAPDARGMLVDRPEALASAGAQLAGAGVADRCELHPGDLFAPPPRADLYLISRVLHDWDDDSAIRILRAIAAAAADADAVHSPARKRPRIRIFEDLLPETGLPTAIQSWSDVVMMALYDGARERTLAHFESLLTRSGWRLVRAVAGPPGVSVIEATLA